MSVSFKIKWILTIMPSQVFSISSNTIYLWKNFAQNVVSLDAAMGCDGAAVKF